MIILNIALCVRFNTANRIPCKCANTWFVDLCFFQQHCSKDQFSWKETIFHTPSIYHCTVNELTVLKRTHMIMLNLSEASNQSVSVFAIRGDEKRLTKRSLARAKRYRPTSHNSVIGYLRPTSTAVVLVGDQRVCLVCIRFNNRACIVADLNYCKWRSALTSYVLLALLNT